LSLKRETLRELTKSEPKLAAGGRLISGAGTSIVLCITNACTSIGLACRTVTR
jgi:hypothetical protein